MRSRNLGMMLLVAAALAWSSATAEALVYNVKLSPYNAVGNGSNDDTNAVQAAINAAAAAGGGEIYFPAGTYKLTWTLSASNNLTFRGEGQRTSTLRWQGLPTDYNGIVYYNATGMADGKYHTLTVRGLSLMRYDGFGGKAIWARWEPAVGVAPYLQGNGSTALLEDFHVGSNIEVNPTASWDAGIYLANAIGAKISGFVIQGVGDSTYSGIEIASNDVAIHDGTITGYYRGIRAWNDTEGLNVQNVVIGDSYFGVHMLYPKKGNAIVNCQISAKSRGFSIYNSQGELAITGNLITRLGASGTFNGIELNTDTGSGRFFRILNNTIVGASTSNIGIVLYNNITDSVIEGNITQSMDYGIWLFNSGVTNTTVMGNINRYATTYAVYNGGTTTHCVYNAPVIAGNPYQCH